MVPSVVASLVRARSGSVSSGSSCSRWNVPPGPVRVWVPPEENPLGSGMVAMTSAPATGWPAASTTTPSSSVGAAELQVGPGPVGRDLQPGAFAGPESQVGLR